MSDGCGKDRLYTRDEIMAERAEISRLTAELAAAKRERDGLAKECDDLKVCWADEEKAHLQTIDERESADDAFTSLAGLLDVETEFSNLRGYDEIIADCEVSLATVRAKERAKAFQERESAYVKISQQLLAKYVELFPAYAWTDEQTAIDLMAAEIATLRIEKAKARAEGLRLLLREFSHWTPWGTRDAVCDRIRAMMADAGEAGKHA